MDILKRTINTVILYDEIKRSDIIMIDESNTNLNAKQVAFSRHMFIR